VADAVAKRDSRIAELREGQFTSLLQATPEFGLAIMRLLTDRVRRRMET
jgi:CRP-like cAMP-binding protein